MTVSSALFNRSTLRALEHHWPVRELVTVGVFSAVAKLSSMLIALAGGGMNPVSLMLKNLVFTTFVVIMLCKVQRPGTLLLFTGVNIVISLIFLGGSVTMIPPMIVAALIGELVIAAAGGVEKPSAVLWGVAFYDLSAKLFSLGLSFLFMRESPAMVLAFVPFVVIGYLGSVFGLFTGRRSAEELRHAGIIRS